MSEFDKFDGMVRERARTEVFSLPEDYAGRVFQTCASLEENRVKNTRQKAGRWLIGVAAALAIFIAIPNLSAPAAQAMEKVPVLGAIVKVITLRRYTSDTAHTHADVSVPEIQGSGSAAAVVNKSVKEYTDELMAKFKTDCTDIGEAYEGLDVSYKVIRNTDGWFTLRIDALETQASGYQFSKIYNINKKTDRTVALGDLFKADSDWQKALDAELIRQMKSQMTEKPDEISYFIEDFQGVKPDRNYYFDKDGNLVLAFDEYEIAPGSMGEVEFTVAKSVYQSCLK